MPSPPKRIAARLDPASAETLETLIADTGVRNLSLIVKNALEAYLREVKAKDHTDAPAPSQVASTQQAPAEPVPAPPPPTPPPPAADTRPAPGSGQVRILTLPFDPAQGRFDDDELRRLLPGRQLRSCTPAFFQQDGRAYWTLWLEYSDRPAAETATPTTLQPADRALFEALRDWRREAAEEAGVPVYAVATNRQLLQVIELRPRTLAALGQVSGFGKKKLTRYGTALLAVVMQHVPDAPDTTRYPHRRE